MTPEKAFQGGLLPKRSHNNLEEHLLSNTTAGNCISTSSNKDIATSFAGKTGMFLKLKPLILMLIKRSKLLHLRNN